MKIILKDGSFKEYENSKSVIEIAADISEGLARVATAGEIDGEVVDLRTVVDKDCELNILTFNDEKGKGAFRHTASHIMARAVKILWRRRSSVCIRMQNWRSDHLLQTDFTMM